MTGGDGRPTRTRRCPDTRRVSRASFTPFTMASLTGVRMVAMPRSRFRMMPGVLAIIVCWAACSAPVADGDGPVAGTTRTAAGSTATTTAATRASNGASGGCATAASVPTVVRSAHVDTALRSSNTERTYKQYVASPSSATSERSPSKPDSSWPLRKAMDRYRPCGRPHVSGRVPSVSVDPGPGHSRNRRSFRHVRCQPNVALTILTWNDESTRAFAGLAFATAPSTLERWAQSDGCAAPAHLTQLTASVRRLHYDGCQGGSTVELYVVDGGGHTWPGSEFSKLSESVLGPTTSEIDANQIIWDFFQAHPKRR